MGGETCFLDHAQYGIGQHSRIELARREIDRDLELLRPGQTVDAGAAKDLFAQFVDQPAVLRKCDENVGRDRAAIGFAPPRERLDAGYLAGRNADDRLVGDVDPAFFDRRAQVALERAAIALRGIHLVIEETRFALRLVLGAVHGEVGVLPQRFDAAAIVGIEDHSDRSPEVRGNAPRLDRLPEPGDDHLRAPRRAFPQSLARHQADEFVAADAGDLGVLVGQVGKAGADHLEHFVPGHMAELVVHRFEPVEVDVQNGEAVLRLDQAFDLGEHAAAVQQAGQRIVIGQPPAGGLGLAHAGDVFGQSQQILVGPVGTIDQHPRRPDMDARGIIAFEFGFGLARSPLGDHFQIIVFEGLARSREQFRIRFSLHRLGGTTNDLFGLAIDQ